MLLGGSVIPEVPAKILVVQRGLVMNIEANKDPELGGRSPGATDRFFVRASSVNVVRRALHRAPGGAAVVGRYDRETIECVHTMDEHSHRRHWPVIVSRLEKACLKVVPQPGSSELDWQDDAP
jgi:hypothetical protein